MVDVGGEVGGDEVTLVSQCAEDMSGEVCVQSLCLFRTEVVPGSAAAMGSRVPL